ncbi:hypothetical protein FA893_18245 [Photobacterium damselae subsp. piscicida]|uniref:hypothetical protein n=1 Tax=Photobacterium damselae TaxID=38293 RepID=UPI0003171AC9|nr:hypothetical protein [Photobacterium damselae]OLQ78689.1 hypothetical protein BEI67_18990 [Photobacterium damselae subsp. piscicida]TFZ63945.1 hypothetical protein E4T25_01390 [Photobacterium damselae subsp. piscicida]TJZ82342.1 hypothetical protein FA893_18245 [Photobacterium damselae subsp. piscicida]
MKEIKLTPRELLEITVDSELLIKVDQLGLNELQLTKIQNIPPNAPKKSGKSIVRVWLENFIKDNEKALDDELKRKQELSESEEKEKQALAEVEKQIEAEKEVQSRISEAKAMIAKWLKLEVIHYISGDKLFICFEKRFSTKEQRYDREWVYLTTEEVEDRYNMFARHMGLSENIHDLLNRDGAKLSLKDVCLEQCLYYNHITSTDKANISRYYFNKLDVERRFWIHESEEFKELVDGDIKCELRPELKCLFVSMTGGKSENFDHLMQVLSWKIHKHYNSSQLPLIMIYG